MIRSIRNLTTRTSLSATAAHNARWFAGLLAGSAMLGAPALAVNNFWEGDTAPTNDWNTPGNWSLGRVPANPNGTTTGDAFDDAFVNSSAPGAYPVLTASPVPIPRDIKVGVGGSTNGRVDVQAGTLTGRGWSVVGDDGGSGTLNIADTSASGGTFTSFGKGSGSYQPGFRLYVGGLDPGAAAGTLNVNTSGTIGMSEELVIGNGSGTGGTVNLDDGTINVGGQTWIGQAADGVGKLRMSGGTLNSNSWMAIARDGAKGTVEMSGGTWNQGGGDTAFIVGTGGLGEMTMSGGTVNVANVTWVAETQGANGSKLTLKDAAVFNTPIMSVGPEGNGTLQLDGGTLRTGRITGKRASTTGGGTEVASGEGTINFNGGQIVATGPNSGFIADVNFLNVEAGGLRVDSNGFDVGVPAALAGPGGVVKSGAGTLSLEGANDFRGASSVTGGKLNVSTDSTGNGTYSVSDGGVLGAVQTAETGVLPMSSLTLTNGGLTVNPAEFSGNPAAAPLKVNGPLVRTGPVALNLIDDYPAVGLLPVVSYTSKSGTGSFVAGQLPIGVILDAASPVVDSGSVVSLKIARVNAPFWTGDNNGVWDTTTANWENIYGGAATTYANGDPAVFEDLEMNPLTYDVTLDSTVSPGAGGVIFDNDLNGFTLSGNGKITGTTGLIKRGTESLTIGNLANEFTGPVTLEEGRLYVGQLANAASASPLGKGTLVLAGGSFNYTGTAPVTIDRGFEINAPTNTAVSEIALASNVTMNGPVTATAGKLLLTGPGVLTLGYPGTISLANGPEGGEPAALDIEGGLTLNGVNQVANVIGNTQMGVGGFATSSLTLAGNAVLNVSRFQAGFGTDSTSSILIQNTAKLHKASGWLSIANSNNAVATMTVRDSGSVVSDAGDFNVGDTGSSNGTLTLENAATVTSVGPVYIAKNGTRGTVNLSGTSKMTSGNTDVAGGDGSLGAVNLAGSSTYTSNGRLLVGPGGGSSGNVTIEDFATMQVNSYVSVGFTGNGSMTIKENGKFSTVDDFSVNEASGAPAVVNVAVQDNGSLTTGGNLFVGRNGGTTGTLTVSEAATLDQTNSERSFFVGLAGTGTLNVRGTSTVTAGSANGVVIGQDGSGVGTVNLEGGTLDTKRVFGNAGTSTVNFSGGLLRAGTGANANFLSGVDNALVNPSGARIDSNNQDIALGQPLLGGTTAGGGLTKSGGGTLRLSGANSYTGTTTVSGGNLGGTATIAGPLVVQNGAGLAPGAVTGTLSANGGVTFNAGSKLVVNLDDSQTADNGLLATTGNLNVTGVTLQVNRMGPAALGSYTIATAGSITGPFASKPAGVTVTYNANSITITPPAATPYESWLSAYNVGSLNQPGDDADHDGMTNLEEFALDGDPSKGGATGKVRSRIETVGGQQALVITLPVRAGATFDNNPGPGLDATVAADDLVYLIKGANDLTTFNQGVTEVSPASAANMPPLSSSAWTYRTFRLNGAIPARGAKGFLSVTVQDAP